ncbi:unnamed protein product [Phytomonas sp. EM1]|nr:unnamed protein product [Phytomonas sp. EM1]|eukprot:CCW64920.1 unnamed protein product [Phytomonas sp. isolate EM1]
MLPECLTCYARVFAEASIRRAKRHGLHLPHLPCPTTELTTRRYQSTNFKVHNTQSQSDSVASEPLLHTDAPNPCSSGDPSSTSQLQSEVGAFSYKPRWRYMAPFRSKSVTDFIFCRDDYAVSIAHTYKYGGAGSSDNTLVTLIPLRHFAHPLFFKQVDDLCCQHDSVLMEGRAPLTGAPHSTMVPPRERPKEVRPPDHEDDEGWEPREMENFFQPFSWGVKDSPNHTVVHAADKYDYEKLPWWCSVRFNAPVLGSLKREKHCLNMIYPLRCNGYRTFAIPWGAAHMPIFHEMLLDNGFEPVGMCSLLLLNRVDGDISEGELGKLRAWQRRRERRGTYLQIFAMLIVLYILFSLTSIEYTSGGRSE